MRYRQFIVVIAALLALGTSTSSHAGQLVTPLASMGEADSALCGVVNAGAESLQITRVEVVDAAGNVAATMPFAVTLDPGNATSISLSGGEPGLVYCRIATSANKKFARGSLIVSDANGNAIYGVAAE